MFHDCSLFSHRRPNGQTRQTAQSWLAPRTVARLTSLGRSRYKSNFLPAEFTQSVVGPRPGHCHVLASLWPPPPHPHQATNPLLRPRPNQTTLYYPVASSFGRPATLGTRHDKYLIPTYTQCPAATMPHRRAQTQTQPNLTQTLYP